MNKFYVYKVGVLACIKIKKNSGQSPLFKVSVVKSASSATYWTRKPDARSWDKLIKAEYPDAKLVECELSFKKVKKI